MHHHPLEFFFYSGEAKLSLAAGAAIFLAYLVPNPRVGFTREKNFVTARACG
jgi:hypothetical protein